MASACDSRMTHGGEVKGRDGHVVQHHAHTVPVRDLVLQVLHMITGSASISAATTLHTGNPSYQSSLSRAAACCSPEQVLNVSGLLHWEGMKYLVMGMLVWP